RTPVTAIQGYAETILQGRGTLDPKTTGEFLEIIHRHARRIGRLVEDLLRLADIEARPPDKLVKEPARIDLLCANVNETARDKLKVKSMSIEVDVEKELTVIGDPDGL